MQQNNCMHTSVAPIIRSVIGKIIYRLVFCILVLDRHHNEKGADTDMCMCSGIHAHVHQMIFLNALCCIFLHHNVAITASVYC